MAKLDARAMGISVGILWSLCVMFVGFTAMTLDWGTAFVEVFSSFYLGYEPTVLGSVIGAAWGACDGFLGGFVIAWLYNKLAK